MRLVGIVLQQRRSGMQGTIGLQSVLEMLRPLSDSNKRWLADRLYEEITPASESTIVCSEGGASRISALRGIAKGITEEQIESDSRLAYILSK